jgi:selT/selW/selH-like putative selenoprotein
LEIECDGALVFSKHETGRFPSYQEIPTRIVEAND